MQKIPPYIEDLRLKNYDGRYVDLTDTPTRRFIGNAVALRVYDALGCGAPNKHSIIHGTVMSVLNDLATAKVRIGK